MTRRDERVGGPALGLAGRGPGRVLAHLPDHHQRGLLGLGRNLALPDPAILEGNETARPAIPLGGSGGLAAAPAPERGEAGQAGEGQGRKQ